MKIKIKVYRFDSEKDKKSYFKVYSIPFTKGMFVLDALNYIQQRLDEALAFRWECRSGICGTCGLMLNGKPVLSCITQIDPARKVNIIEPMANFPVEKDLIVDLSFVLEKLSRIRPYLEETEKVRVTEKLANMSKPFRKCIECGCCIAGARSKQGVLNPMTLVKLARFETDPRDKLNRKLIAKSEGLDKYKISEGKDLNMFCPRAIPIDRAIKLLKQ